MRDVLDAMTARSVVAGSQQCGGVPSPYFVKQPFSRTMSLLSCGMHRSICNCRPDSLHRPLRCPKSSRVSNVTLLRPRSLHIQVPIHLNVDYVFDFSHAARNVCRAGSLGSPCRTVDLALFLSSQAFSNSVRMAASPRHTGIRGSRVGRGTPFSVALRSASAKFAAGELIVLPGLHSLPSLTMNLGELLTSVGVRYYHLPVDRSRPNWDSPRSVVCEATEERQ